MAGEEMMMRVGISLLRGLRSSIRRAREEEGRDLDRAGLEEWVGVLARAVDAASNDPDFQTGVAKQVGAAETDHLVRLTCGYLSQGHGKDQAVSLARETWEEIASTVNATVEDSVRDILDF